MSEKAATSVTDILRKQFPAEMVGKLPRVTCPKCSDKNNRSGKCDEHEKRKCGICQAFVSERHIHIDYVGHADVTARLLEADPEWQWEPLATDEHGLPLFDTDDRGGPVGLWIRLTVGGVARLGYGSAPSGQSDAVKVLIGDALRNAAMRFGVALDLWAKGDRADPTAENATASGGQAARRQQSARRDQPAQAPQAPKPADGEPDPEAQPFADEVAAATSVAQVTEIHCRAREAHKLAALIRNPATGGTGGFGQYANWRRGQLQETEKALADLEAAAKAGNLSRQDLAEHVALYSPKGLEGATAAELKAALDALGAPALAGASA